MTKTESQQLEGIWAKIENLVTLLDPHFSLKDFHKKMEEENDIFPLMDDWLDFLRIGIKYKLFDIESLTRERDSFFKMLMDKKG